MLSDLFSKPVVWNYCVCLAMGEKIEINEYINIDKQINKVKIDK